MAWVLGLIRATELPAAGGASVRFERKAFTDITKADLEAFRDARRAVLAASAAALERATAVEAQASHATTQIARRTLRRDALALRRSAKCRPGAKGGEVGINRLLARLRHVFSWAIEEGYTTDTPFKRGPVTVVRLATRAETARTRRLEPGEEERLCTHAGSHLRALIVAELSTGCRLGELLSLQWQQIRRDESGAPRWIRLASDDTKTNEARALPIGARLRAELEMRQHAPDGQVHPLEAYVFGNACGERINCIKTAWRATCRRAGIRNLHFHDLRREFASRLRESGASDHEVAAFLGHANITTTSRYLQSTPLRLERALADMEAGDVGRIRTPFAHSPDSEAPADADSLAIDTQKPLIQ